MKPLDMRQQQTVADPLQAERLLRALTIMLEPRRTGMEGALSARVSPHPQQHAGTIERQRHALKEPGNPTEGPCCPSMRDR